MNTETTCYYLHDITTTTLSNRELLAYCVRHNVDMNEMPRELRNHLTQCNNKRTDVAILQCYEWDGNRVRQDAKHIVTVVGETYSHYVRDENGENEMSTADADSYDFATRRYKKMRFRKEGHFSEQESNRRVLQLFRNGDRVYGNSHKFINEFCYNLYEKHLDTPEFKGRLIRKPTNGITRPLLMCQAYIESETVVFGSAADINVVDDSHITDFGYKHKTLSFDIETIMVDAAGKKIQDRIIQLSAVYQEGTAVLRCVGITVGDASCEPDDYEFSYMKKFFENSALPATDIYCVADERQLIAKFIDIVKETKPDYLAGYNVIGFDLPVIVKSADRHGIDLVDELSQTKGFALNKACVKKSLEASRKRKGASTLEDNQHFELSYTLFPGMLVNDLYRCHKDEKLDDLAKSALGVGKDDVSYADIPLLYYSDETRDRSKLMKYNVLDSLLCTALISVNDDFSSYKFFVTSSYASKIPHSEFFNMQKTTLIVPMFYYAFRQMGMLQDMKIKPLAESHKLCVEQITRHFMYGVPCTYPLAQEVVEKFSSGEIKTKTLLKQFSFDEKFGQLQAVDIVTAIDVLKKQFASAQQKNTKHGPHNFYTLTHLMLYLRFLNDAVEESYDLEGLICEFYKTKRVGRYAAANIAKRKSMKSSSTTSVIGDERQLTDQLLHFSRYLASRSVSSTHTARQLVEDYCENEMINAKYKDKVDRFAAYLNRDDSGPLRQEFRSFLKLLSESKERRRFQDSHYAQDTFCEQIWNVIEGNVLMKFDTPSKYDGAWVCLPNPGVEFERPVCCVDFSSLYPTLGISYNVGPETIVSRRTIVDNNLAEGSDYEVINLYARDDHRKTDIRSLSDREAAANYVCFAKPRRVKSVYCKIWADILENRLRYKKLIGTFPNASDNKRVKEMSDTFKISANSVYGVLPHMGQWKISAAITSRGRQNIQDVAKDIERTHGSVTMYGDSVMPYTPITYKNETGRLITATMETIAAEEDYSPYSVFKLHDGDGTRRDKEQHVPEKPIYVLTKSGWSRVRRIIRHTTRKKIYRVVTHTGIVDVTEDHSLLDPAGRIITPAECNIGTRLLHTDEKLVGHGGSYITEPMAYVFGMFVGDGSCGSYRTKSGMKYSWVINNLDRSLLDKCQVILKTDFALGSTVLDTRNSSGVYKLVPAGNTYGANRDLVEKFRSECYVGSSKIVPTNIINANNADVLRSFADGLYDSDGCRRDFEKIGCRTIDTKNQVTASSYAVLFRLLGYKTSVDDRTDKQLDIFRITYTTEKQRKDPIAVKKLRVLYDAYDGYVYDVETADGSFNAGIGSIVLKNTDSVMYHLDMTTDQLCESYGNGEMLARDWISTADRERIDSYSGDYYKQGCEIAAAVSRKITEEMNCRYLTGSDRTIYFPPSQLDHEKVMLPFVIFAQKHYFARIMDTDDDQKAAPYILRGLECRKRTKLQATDDVENAMFADLLQQNPCTWNTYRLASDIVGKLSTESMDLTKIASRKKITVIAKDSKKTDAGAQLCTRMKDRGELVDTGGLDKISVKVIKVKSDGKTVKYESLDYLSKRQRDGLPLQLDSKAIARQVLMETVKIMTVIHPKTTCRHFVDLLDLKTASSVQEEEFGKFVTPTEARKIKDDDAARSSKGTKPSSILLNDTMFNFLSASEDEKKRSRVVKRKNDGGDKGTQVAKRLKQTTINFV